MPRERAPVVYIIVDGLSTQAFEQATASGRAPAFAFLKEHGSYVRESVAVFPTITPAATASLVTGEVPARHGIPGMCWYDVDEQRFVNYGQSLRSAVLEGVSQLVEDIVVHMNQHHLSRDVQTIHERLDAMGLVTASVNFMVFRGPYEKKTEPSLLERLLIRKRLPESLWGPRELYLLDVVNGSADPCSETLSKRGLEERIKATDRWAACVTRDLLERDAADMILFYLHENDHYSHRQGPGRQVENIQRVDENLAYVLDAFSSWERAVDEVGFVVTSDHSQTPVPDDKNHVLRLEDVFDEEFDAARAGRRRRREKLDDHELACAGNGRVGFIYLNKERRGRLREQVVRTLKQHEAVDQVMWRDDDLYVVDSERGRVVFWEAESGGVVDERGHKWSFEGELGAVDGVVEEDELRTPEYPLAFWRIKSALDLDRTGDVVVTAKLTYEFEDLAGADHRGGGDHASLHAQDSIVPFLSTLASPPLHPSTVDVAPHIVAHFESSRSG